MGKVSSFIINGCQCWFNSSDHRPPHFHLKENNGYWEIRVYINTTTINILDYDFKFPSQRKLPIAATLEKKLRTLITLHRQNLMIEWNNKVIND